VFDTQVSASAFAALGPVETVQRQLSWQNTLATPAGTALALLERIEQHVQRPGTPFAVSDRAINAGALGLNGSAAGHTWQASLRHDRNSQFGGQTTGALGYGYDVTPAWRVAASYGTSFVAPSFNQLYFPGFGNPDLQPEEGKHGELSVRWTAGDHSVRAAWFEHRIRSYISSGPAPANIPRTRIDGATLSYDGRWNDLVLGASLDHVDPRNATTASPSFDKQLPRRAKKAIKAHADWTHGDFGVGATWVAFSERYDNAVNTLRLPGYGTLDLRADWSFAPDWTLGARLNNAAGKIYETVYGYNQPGRELYVSLRYAPR
jgi:vitamin B12 transporter